MKLRQISVRWIFNNKHIPGLIIQIFSLFVPEIGIGISITDNLAWSFYLNGTMVCTDDHLNTLGSNLFNKIKQRRSSLIISISVRACDSISTKL